MEYKRLEIYVWWTCNQKCTYCMEFPNMEKAWNKKVSKLDILKKLLKYKLEWYNHVTYLWGEPFIQWVFLDALKLAKKLWYTVLVTTNATTLHIDNQAQKFLPYIDELFLSVEALTIEDQQKISRTKNYVHWEWVFENINKYWNWKMLKANIVITKDNLNILFEIVEYLNKKWVKNIAITYPDIYWKYYTKDHIIDKIAPKYNECTDEILKIIDFCEKNNIFLKLPDFPFCIFPQKNLEKYIKLTDDYDYANRVKITYDEKELKRETKAIKQDLPRARKHVKVCKNCSYIDKCWWPSSHYEAIYWLQEIIPITK